MKTRVAAVLALATLAACSSGHKSTFTAVAPPKAALPVAAAVPAGTTIGVVVTYSSAAGEGQEELGAAAGVRVAEYRYGLAAAGRVKLVVVGDGGTADGGVAAVKQLMASNVSAIVWASEGSHLTAGVTAASAAGVPVLLPYSTDAALAALPGVWLTGPDEKTLLTSMKAQLTAQKATAPLYVTTADHAGVVTPFGTPLVVTPGSTLAATVTGALAKANTGYDSVVVWAPSETSADVVAALQATTSALPVVLGPQALLPAFGDTLAADAVAGSATQAGDYTTVGLPDGEFGPRSSAAAGFYTALRAASTSDGVLSLDGTKPFGDQGAATADARSHDAVVALVKAVGVAASTKPADVAKALAGLMVTGDDGVVETAMAFRAGSAFPSDVTLVGLRSTVDPSGQRPATATSTLGWFPLTSKS